MHKTWFWIKHYSIFYVVLVGRESKVISVEKRSVVENTMVESLREKPPILYSSNKNALTPMTARDTRRSRSMQIFFTQWAHGACNDSVGTRTTSTTRRARAPANNAKADLVRQSPQSPQNVPTPPPQTDPKFSEIMSRIEETRGKVDRAFLDVTRYPQTRAFQREIKQKSAWHGS